MMEDHIADAISDHPQLTKMTAALFVILRDAKGRIVTHSSIEVQLEDYMGYAPTRTTIAGSGVKRLRRMIESEGYTIESAKGVGYKLVIPKHLER